MSSSYEFSTDIIFSSVEEAITQINESKENIEGYLEDFASAVRELIANKYFVGSAADSFEEGFDRLKKEKFDTYIALVNDFSKVISAGKHSTEDTAKDAETDATTNLYLG